MEATSDAQRTGFIFYFNALLINAMSSHRDPTSNSHCIRPLTPKTLGKGMNPHLFPRYGLISKTIITISKNFLDIFWL